MSYYLSEQASELSRRMISVEVYRTDSSTGNGLHLQVCLMEADHTARELSKLVAAAGGRVELIDDARIRAVYQNGERIRQSDMRDHYVMSDEAYAESKILCSKQHEYF